jgi:exopolyphosphatase/pppGpp-phosphohydrolase
MDNDIQVQYKATRLDVSSGMPITVLHIGEDKTAIAFGTDAEPEAVLVLSIGSNKTAVDFFKHTPPTPEEMETAIMVVEDEVTRARKLLTGHPTLFTKDVSIRELALIAGVSDQPEMVLSLEAVERTFDLLASLVLGRPAASAGIPTHPAFATTLLILREFMHHLQFDSIRIGTPSM